MRQRLENTLRAWLRLELRGGSADAAERLLGELWQAVREPAPGERFADRVLLAVGHGGVEPAPAPLPAAVQWAARLAIAACLVVAGLGVLFVPPALSALARLLQLDAVLHGGVDVLLAGLAWLGRGLAFWDVLADVGRAIGLAATAPEVAGPLAGATLLAVLAFLLLVNLTSRERSFAHADRAPL